MPSTYRDGMQDSDLHARTHTHAHRREELAETSSKVQETEDDDYFTGDAVEKQSGSDASK